MRNGKRIYDSGFKLWIVEQAGKPGVSVAALAMRYGVNANQLRRWMGLPHWHACEPAATVLPVTIVAERDQPSTPDPGIESSTTAVAVIPKTQPAVMAPAAPVSEPASVATIEITVGQVSVRVNGAVDLRALRTVIEALRA